MVKDRLFTGRSGERGGDAFKPTQQSEVQNEEHGMVPSTGDS